MAASAGASENLVLFLSLVPYVMDRGEVSVAEAAAQFDRHPDDIKRAVELIACAGIPGDSTAYLHTDLFDIDWDLFEEQEIIRFEQTIVIDQQPRFSARELSALIAGLQYIAAHPAYGERSDVHTLLDKLRGVDPQAADRSMLVKPQVQQQTISELSQAIARGTQVHFDYVNRLGEAERRTVDPVALEARDDTWYLRGWCHSRDALRVFRLDRMSGLDVSDEPSLPRPDAGSVDSWQIFTPSDTDLVVTVSFEESALPVVAEYLDRSRPPEKDGNQLVAAIPFAHEASLIRFVAAHAGLVRVLAPKNAVSAVAAWAKTALSEHA